MTAQTQAEALQIADECDASADAHLNEVRTRKLAAAELRRLHAENEGLRAERAAIIAEKDEMKLALRHARRALEAQAQPAREPLTDEEIERLHADLQARKLAAQEALYQSRIGMQCGMCAEGRYQASSNGYSKFHRCDKCTHVTFWREDGKEFTAHGITKEKP